MVVALVHHLHIPSREAVGSLGDLHHEDRVAEVNEGERLNRDDCSRSTRHYVIGNILHSSTVCHFDVSLELQAYLKILCFIDPDLQPTGEAELACGLPLEVHEAISQDYRGLGQSNVHHFYFVLSYAHYILHKQ